MFMAQTWHQSCHHDRPKACTIREREKHLLNDSKSAQKGTRGERLIFCTHTFLIRQRLNISSKVMQRSIFFFILIWHNNGHRKMRAAIVRTFLKYITDIIFLSQDAIASQSKEIFLISELYKISFHYVVYQIENCSNRNIKLPHDDPCFSGANFWFDSITGLKILQ